MVGELYNIDFEGPKSTSGVISLCVGRRTFVPKCGMCKKPTSISHSFTESEVSCPDGCLRKDGIPTLDLCDFVVK